MCFLSYLILNNEKTGYLNDRISSNRFHYSRLPSLLLLVIVWLATSIIANMAA